MEREVLRSDQRKRYAAKHDMAAEQRGQRHPLVNLLETIDHLESFAWRANGGHYREQISQSSRGHNLRRLRQNFAGWPIQTCAPAHRLKRRVFRDFFRSRNALICSGFSIEPWRPWPPFGGLLFTLYPISTFQAAGSATHVCDRNQFRHQARSS
jgi:hypothetical protein